VPTSTMIIPHFLQAGSWMPFLPPNQQFQSTEGNNNKTSGHSNLTQGRIIATDGRFNRIRQVAPMCPPMRAIGATWLIRWNLCFLQPTRVHNLNGKSIGSAIFAELTAVSSSTLTPPGENKNDILNFCTLGPPGECP